MVTNHRELSDHDFLHQLEYGTIDPALFNHEAHVRMAWLYLTRSELKSALSSISTAIRQLDDKYADGQKYHHTITIFFSLIIAIQIRENKSVTWESLITEHQALANPKTLLNEYYHEKTLYSYRARKLFVSPDKKLEVYFLKLAESCF